MSWQIVGAVHPRDPKSPVYGPHPAKRWIGPARPRGYRAPRPLAFPKSSATPTEYNETRAELYARWLAARDGIELAPGLKAVAIVTKFRSVITGENIRRIEAVEFGERAAYGSRGVVGKVATIAIPHWDFEHAEPIEELDAPAAPAPVAQQQQITW